MSIKGEQTLILTMTKVYCAKHHGGKGLCQDCQAIQDYALTRLSKCPFAECKPTCKKCPIHCYRSPMREQVAAIMRYAGPRMLWHHPILSLQHVLQDRFGKNPSLKSKFQG